MISKKVIFFHIPKSGGSSIEQLLLHRRSWRMDLLVNLIFKETPFSLWMVGSMRHRIWRHIIFYLSSLFLTDWKHLWGICGHKVLHHLTYMELYQNPTRYLKYKLSRYHKFAVVRNPYDRIISAYHFLGHGLHFRQFIDWVQKELDQYYRHNLPPFVVILPQWEFIINENGANGMDYTLRFETLAQDFKKLKRKLHLHGKLQHLNKRTRRTMDITAYFDKETEEKVYRLYYRDFKMFGYPRMNKYF